jgi:predicted NodU family carbamoyl transferase
VEEERFRGVKHWVGFPRDTGRAYLELAGVAPEDIGHFGISGNPRANLSGKWGSGTWKRGRLLAIQSMEMLGLVEELEGEELGG